MVLFYPINLRIIVMKKLLTICLFIVFAVSTFAQEYEYVPFPTKNAVWSEVFYYYGSYPYPNDTMNVIYALFDEDTLMYGKIYHKLFMLTDSIISKERAILDGYITEENKIVYYVRADFIKGGKIYDFNLNMGDMFDFYMGDVPVVKIDTVLIENTLRKRYYLWSEDGHLTWIEGIGSLRGLLYSVTWPLNENHDLLCYTFNDTTFYYNDKFGTCYPDYPGLYTTINEPKPIQELNLYPNPVTDLLNYSLPEKPVGGKLRIITIDGKIQLQKMILNKKGSIDVGFLENGMYQLIINTSNQQVFTKIFLKADKK